MPVLDLRGEGSVGHRLEQARREEDAALDAERAAAKAERDARDLAGRVALQTGSGRGPVMPAQPPARPLVFIVSSPLAPAACRYEAVLPAPPPRDDEVQAHLAPFRQQLYASLCNEPCTRRRAVIDPQFKAARDALNSLENRLAVARQERLKAVERADAGLIAVLDRVDREIEDIDAKLPVAEKRVKEIGFLAANSNRTYLSTWEGESTRVGLQARQALQEESELLLLQLHALPEVVDLLGKISDLQQAARLVEMRRAHEIGVEDRLRSDAAPRAAE